MKIPAELLEKMAKEHRNHDEKGLPYGNPYTDKGLLEKMQAALDVLEAEGMVVAPKEPTDEMLDAACLTDAETRINPKWRACVCITTRKRWVAMIAASVKSGGEKS